MAQQGTGDCPRHSSDTASGYRPSPKLGRAHYYLPPIGSVSSFQVRDARDSHGALEIPTRPSADIKARGCRKVLNGENKMWSGCLLYTSDAADDLLCVDL